MTVAPSDAAGLRAQLEATWGSLLELGRSLDDADFATPTRCPGWDVRAQFAHVLGTESMLASRPSPPAAEGRPPHVRNDIGSFNEAWVTQWSSQPPAELLDELAAVVAARSEALAGMDDEAMAAPSWTPVGQATYGRFMQIRVFDCWVHEQDVRAAVDRPGHQSGPAAEQALDEVERNLGYVVAKRAATPPGTLVGFSLHGPLARDLWVEVPPEGRAGVVADPGRPAEVTIALDGMTFMALACGRVTPMPVMADITGDRVLGARIVEHLAFTI
ncbi:MAG TPA: maleylpyruvate isomerase family mycothiol-dependent enzyme [Acidimicrobiales bacterium]|nr:maleylpyruvate isomerase family mycothiol-dependent enzyme [Acidimicrobiales bacterium]